MLTENEIRSASEDVARVLQLLHRASGRPEGASRMVGDACPDPALDRHVELTKVAHQLYRIRRARDAMLGKPIFGEPAWDILLDLYAGAETRKACSVTSSCIAAAVPATTALRHIRNLVEVGLVDRRPDKDDHRRHLLDLTDAGRSLMENALGRAVLA